MARSRAWCFTWNNYNEESENLLASLECQYLVYGREVAPETGTPHLQGYVHFGKIMRFNRIKKLLLGCHVLPAKGSAQQNHTYCTKSDPSPFVKGTIPQDSKEAGCKYAAAVKLARQGKIDEVDPQMLLRYNASLERIAARSQVVPADATHETGIWIYGVPGCGKSSLARDLFKGRFVDKNINKWFNLQDWTLEKDVLLLEDFDHSNKCTGSALKRWCDRYAFPVEVKFSSGSLRPEWVVITSNYLPGDIWADDPALADAITRRCSIYHLDYYRTPGARDCPDGTPLPEWCNQYKKDMLSK